MREPRVENEQCTALMKGYQSVSKRVNKIRTRDAKQHGGVTTTATSNITGTTLACEGLESSDQIEHYAVT